MRQRKVKKYQGVSGSSLVTTPLPSYMQQLDSFVGQMLQQPPVQFDPTGYNGTQGNWSNPTMPTDPAGDPTLRLADATPTPQIKAPTSVNAPSTVNQFFPQHNQASERKMGEIVQRSAWGEPNPNTILPLRAANTIGLAIANRHQNNQRENEMKKRLNNPYLGQLGSNDGRSDNVRFGYQQYQLGGRATTQDSLALYNNSKALEKYYSNYSKLVHNKPLEGDEDVTGGNKFLRDNLAEIRKRGSQVSTNRTNGNPDKNFTMDDYYRKLNNNQYLQRETMSDILDLRAPMAMYDDRVQPQYRSEYVNLIPKDPMMGDVVDYYAYDPIAVKPYAMLTPEEKKIRDAKYPTEKAEQPQSKIKKIPKPPPPPRPVVGSNPRGPIDIPQSSINVQADPATGQTLQQPTGPYSITYPTFENQQSTQNAYFQDEASWNNALNNLKQTPRSKQQGSNSGSALFDGKPDAKYQEGGEVDPFDTLFDQVYGELENPTPEQVNQIEAPTTDDVDRIQAEAAMSKKAQGRAIVDSYNPQGEDDYQRVQRRGEGEDYGNMGSAPAMAPNEAAKFAHQHYVSKGIPEHISAGIIGNLMQESGLNPHVKGDDGKATGIAQWHPDRFKGLNRWAEKNGRNAYDLTTQLDYILEEPGESQKVLDKLLKTNSAEEAAHIFSNTYERPNKKYAANDKRAGYAKGLMGFAKGGTYYVDDADLLNLQTNGVKFKFLD